VSKPLEGIRVLELTTFVAAPVSGRLLGDMGASVIKVERISGDDWRETAKSFNARFNDDQNPVFDIYNSGKRCISLDLKKKDGMDAFMKLMEQADVFITNTRPQALKRLGVAYEDMKERFPRLIYALVIGFGEEGPDAGVPAFDTTAFWTRSGFVRDMAVDKVDYEPILTPSGAGDTVTGLNLLAQITAALFRRERTGKGDLVQSSLYHSGIFTMGNMQIVSQKPWGNKYPRSRAAAGLSGHYACSDGEWVFAAVGYRPVFVPKMFKMLEREDLAQDPRFITDAEVGRHIEDLRKIFVEELLKKPSTYWVQRAREFDLTLVYMNHFSDVSTDEQAWANGYLENVEFRDGKTAVMPRSPLHMDSIGEITTKIAPRIGTHTAEVLSELGYTQEQIEAMKQAGAIRTVD